MGVVPKFKSSLNNGRDIHLVQYLLENGALHLQQVE
jgi:hypothetical protein